MIRAALLALAFLAKAAPLAVWGASSLTRGSGKMRRLPNGRMRMEIPASPRR